MSLPGTQLGLEMEMVVARRDNGESHIVSGYFPRLAQLKAKRGEAVTLNQIGSQVIGVYGPAGESGLDNGYNLLETSFSPVMGGPGGLNRLAARVRQELLDVQETLAQENATVLNASEHPFCLLDHDWYMRIRVPRPIYDELVGYRGWHHHIGIDAKAQNSPCTSVAIRDAVRALNVVLALAPAVIALFANSPLEGGRVTGLKENRLTLWDRMFKYSRFTGDHFLQRLPEQPFVDLGDYFRWMFGPNTVSRALPLATGADYKVAVPIHLDGDPSLSQFLAAASWIGRRADTGESVVLQPHSVYFEYSQFAHFLDARWRYQLTTRPPLPELLEAWGQLGGIEELYERCGVDGYIEGRAPGAVFADAQLLQEAGTVVASSVPIAPSAIQLGLMRNLNQAEQLLRDWGWLQLRTLRATAIRYALENETVHALATEVMEVARGGLAPDEHRWLAYADYVLATRCTGADRLLTLWNQTAAIPQDALATVCAARAAIVT
jgi:hypothetical protein